MTDSLLSIEQLTITYPHSNKPAVHQVSLTLNAGDRLGLVGESGCGKSTIGKTLLQLLPPQSQILGDIKYQGKSIFKYSSEELRKMRGEVVGLVFQDPMTRLDPLMTIGEHCLETLKAHQPELSKKQAKEKAIDTLKKVKINADRWDQFPHEFSGGMRQRVAIALALLLNPKIIIADEPTTSLDVTVSAEILQELTRLCTESNMGLLIISHDLAMIGEYCTQIAVMYNGDKVETGEVQTIFKDPQHPYTQSLLNSALHLHENQEKPLKVNPQKPLLKLTNLKQYYTIEGNFLSSLFNKNKQEIKAVDNLNLEIYEGEILGLVGESGCGKSTLSRTILQLIKPTSGKVEFQGVILNELSLSQMREKRRDIQMIFQDPHACLNPLMTIGESIADPLYIHSLATPETAQIKVKKVLEKVGLNPDEYYHRYPKQLSGGQQQRVAIARALITEPKFIICDEPVSMLDASVQTQVLELMLQLKQDYQLTYLFITHDLWVAKFLCDRIAVMNKGHIVELGKTEDIFNHPQDDYTKKLLNSAPLLSILQ